MINAKNVISIQGGLVADPEMVSDKVIRMRMACDYSGSDKSDPENKTGYFDVTYFVNDNSNSKFVTNQISVGNLKKGSQIMLVGSLSQDRWKQEDGSNRSSVKIIAESISYAGGGKPASDSNNNSGSNGPAPAPSASVPDQF